MVGQCAYTEVFLQVLIFSDTDPFLLQVGIAETHYYMYNIPLLCLVIFPSVFSVHYFL